MMVKFSQNSRSKASLDSTISQQRRTKEMTANTYKIELRDRVIGMFIYIILLMFLCYH